MIRLVFSDLRENIATWAGAFAVALACGLIGGWAVSMMATADGYTEGLRRILQNAGSMMLVFSLVAAIAVLSSAANLTVAAQRRSYALWQLANVRPSFVSRVVLGQLAVVAFLGAVCGTVFSAVTFIPLFPAVMSAQDQFAHVAPRVDLSKMPGVWFMVAGVFLCGGMRGARNAAKTPPLTVLREPEPKRSGMTVLRVLLFVALVDCTVWIAFIMGESESDVVMNYSMYVPLLVTAAAASIAPVVFSVLLRIWTSLVPQKHWNAWFLARRNARYGLSASSSVETPVMVGFGLAAGIFSVVSLWEGFAISQGATDFTGIDLTTSLLMLGGPVLLCAVGAAVSVIMTSRTRTRDVALLIASGAPPETLMASAVCEALIHAVTATLVGVASVVCSNAIVAHAIGVPLLEGLAFGGGLVVSLVGFALVLVATLAPTYRALNRETAMVLSARG